MNSQFPFAFGHGSLSLLLFIGLEKKPESSRELESNWVNVLKVSQRSQWAGAPAAIEIEATTVSFSLENFLALDIFSRQSGGLHLLPLVELSSASLLVVSFGCLDQVQGFFCF